MWYIEHKRTYVLTYVCTSSKTEFGGSLFLASSALDGCVCMRKMRDDRVE